MLQQHKEKLDKVTLGTWIISADAERLVSHSSIILGANIDTSFREVLI